MNEFKVNSIQLNWFNIKKHPLYLWIWKGLITEKQRVT